MSRAITAIYRTFATADLVRDELEQLGIARRHITVVPEATTVPDTADASRSTTTRIDADDASDQIRRLDLPEKDARTYQQAVMNGDCVVSVELHDDAQLDRVQAIMSRPEDGLDLDRTAVADTGVTGYRDGKVEDDTVEVVEESLAVGKREVDRGSVRIRSHVREVPVEADVELRETRVHLERRPVDRPAGPEDLAGRDQVLEAQEFTEEAVVSKEARVVEEIGLRSETEVDHETIHDTVRKTEVEVDDGRTGNGPGLTGDRAGRDRR